MKTKERAIVIGGVSVLALVLVFALGNTDVIYVVVSILFFALCVAYAVGCEKL